MKFNESLLYWEFVKVVPVDLNVDKSGIVHKESIIRVIVSTDRYVALSNDPTLAVTSANGALHKAGQENFIKVGEWGYICFSAAIVPANDSVCVVK
jgi:hypothetical protein